MAATTLDELAALGEELLAGLARMHETVDAMGQSLTALEQTTAELRQDVTRLGERVEWIGSRGIMDRLEQQITGLGCFGRAAALDRSSRSERLSAGPKRSLPR